MQFNFWPLNKTLPIDALINRSLFGAQLCFCFLCSMRSSRQLEGEYSAERFFVLVIFYIWIIQIWISRIILKNMRYIIEWLLCFYDGDGGHELCVVLAQVSPEVQHPNSKHAVGEGKCRFVIPLVQVGFWKSCSPFLGTERGSRAKLPLGTVCTCLAGLGWAGSSPGASSRCLGADHVPISPICTLSAQIWALSILINSTIFPYQLAVSCYILILSECSDLHSKWLIKYAINLQENECFKLQNSFFV